MKTSFKKQKITENKIAVAESNTDVYKNNNIAVGNENTSPGCNNSIFGEERISSQGNIFFEWKSVPNSAPFSTFTQFSLLSDFSHHFPSVFSATNDPMSKSLSMLPYVHESTPRPLKIVEPRQQQIHFALNARVQFERIRAARRSEDAIPLGFENALRERPDQVLVLD